MKKAIRVNVILKPEQMGAVRDLANAKGVSEPEILRTALDYYIRDSKLVDAVNGMGTRVDGVDDRLDNLDSELEKITDGLNKIIQNAVAQNQKLAVLESVFNKAR